MDNSRLDPVTLSVLASALAGIAEEMGAVLIRGSYSSNIKERRDCSTALFNAAGETLCQAEHIPIHLGSFIELVPHIMKRYRVEDIRPGDAFIGNDAYEGGETTFPELGIVHRGVVGEGLYFINAHPDLSPDRRMLHTGSPPTAGEKWIVSQFIVSKALRP